MIEFVQGRFFPSRSQVIHVKIDPPPPPFRLHRSAKPHARCGQSVYLHVLDVKAPSVLPVSPEIHRSAINTMATDYREPSVCGTYLHYK